MQASYAACVKGLWESFEPDCKKELYLAKLLKIAARRKLRIES